MLFIGLAQDFFAELGTIVHGMPEAIVYRVAEDTARSAGSRRVCCTGSHSAQNAVIHSVQSTGRHIVRVLETGGSAVMKAIVHGMLEAIVYRVLEDILHTTRQSWRP